jgi:hypothetical protein
MLKGMRHINEEKRTVLHGMPMEKIFTIREQVTKICQYP